MATKPTKPTPTIDYSAEFASNSSLVPYTWTASDYARGWEIVGSIPPTKQQFDALHKRSDAKENWLYNYYLEQYVDPYLLYHDDVIDGLKTRITTVEQNPPGNVGEVFAFAGSVIPDGFLRCDGAALSRADYVDLFGVIGTAYGVGDGSTTFNLPNLTDKFIQGSTTVGTVKSAGLPNITGNVDRISSTGGSTSGGNAGIIASGAFERAHFVTAEYAEGQQRTYYHGFNFDASLSNQIYGNSDTVQPPALTMIYIIRY